MIFDTEKMAKLRAKYAGVPNYKVPKIVFLDRYDGLAGERALLEQLLGSESETKRRDWLGRLLTDDDGQFLGAWFEMLLLDWLKSAGSVTVEPELSSGTPDFLVTLGETECYVEARAIGKSDEERNEDIRDAEIFELLHSILRPFMVIVEDYTYGGALDRAAFLSEVEQWLDNTPTCPLEFTDKRDNQITLTAEPKPRLRSVGVVGPDRGGWVNPHVLQQPLKDKAQKYKPMTRSDKPYVIAVLLESFQLSSEEVVEAWFGRPTVVVDVESGTVVEEKLDGSGLHYRGGGVRHKSISGTLVFRARLNEPAARYELHGVFVENPYSTTPIDSTLFPVASRYCVVEQTKTHYRMKWLSNS